MKESLKCLIRRKFRTIITDLQLIPKHFNSKVMSFTNILTTELAAPITKDNGSLNETTQPLM